jgi:hypothetical protein
MIREGFSSLPPLLSKWQGMNIHPFVTSHICESLKTSHGRYFKGTTLRRQKEVVPVFLSNGISSTLIIPIAMARRYNWDKPSHVVLESKDEGILIKKLEI